MEGEFAAGVDNSSISHDIHTHTNILDQDSAESDLIENARMYILRVVGTFAGLLNEDEIDVGTAEQEEEASVFASPFDDSDAESDQEDETGETVESELVKILKTRFKEETASKDSWVYKLFHTTSSENLFPLFSPKSGLSSSQRAQLWFMLQSTGEYMADLIKTHLQMVQTHSIDNENSSHHSHDMTSSTEHISASSSSSSLSVPPAASSLHGSSSNACQLCIHLGALCNKYRARTHSLLLLHQQVSEAQRVSKQEHESAQRLLQVDMMRTKQQLYDMRDEYTSMHTRLESLEAQLRKEKEHNSLLHQQKMHMVRELDEWQGRVERYDQEKDGFLREIVRLKSLINVMKANGGDFSDEEQEDEGIGKSQGNSGLGRRNSITSDKSSELGEDIPVQEFQTWLSTEIQKIRQISPNILDNIDENGNSIQNSQAGNSSKNPGSGIGLFSGTGISSEVTQACSSLESMLYTLTHTIEQLPDVASLASTSISTSTPTTASASMLGVDVMSRIAGVYGCAGADIDDLHGSDGSGVGLGGASLNDASAVDVDHSSLIIPLATSASLAATTTTTTTTTTSTSTSTSTSVTATGTGTGIGNHAGITTTAAAAAVVAAGTGTSTSTTPTDPLDMTVLSPSFSSPSFHSPTFNSPSYRSSSMLSQGSLVLPEPSSEVLQHVHEMEGWQEEVEEGEEAEEEEVKNGGTMADMREDEGRTRESSKEIYREYSTTPDVSRKSVPMPLNLASESFNSGKIEVFQLPEDIPDSSSDLSISTATTHTRLHANSAITTSNSVNTINTTEGSATSATATGSDTDTDTTTTTTTPNATGTTTTTMPTTTTGHIHTLPSRVSFTLIQPPNVVSQTPLPGNTTNGKGSSNTSEFVISSFSSSENLDFSREHTFSRQDSLQSSDTDTTMVVPLSFEHISNHVCDIQHQYNDRIKTILLELDRLREEKRHDMKVMTMKNLEAHLYRRKLREEIAKSKKRQEEMHLLEHKVLLLEKRKDRDQARHDALQKVSFDLKNKYEQVCEELNKMKKEVSVWMQTLQSPAAMLREEKRRREGSSGSGNSSTKALMDQMIMNSHRMAGK